MHRSFRSAAILALLAALPALAGELRSVSTPPPALLSVHPDKSACWAGLETDYYTDATHTTLTGRCTVTCQQWDLGNDIPAFGGGGKCTGTPSSFVAGGPLRLCPCPP
jgi:hypothetical protein